MQNKINFEVDKYELIDEVSESRLTKIKLWIARDGENLHNMPITKDAILDSKKTLVGKPILASLNWTKTDFQGHEDNEIAVGVILKEEDVTIEEIDGETWTVAIGYIWKKYFPRVVEVLRNKDGKTSISMEITMLETEMNDMEQQVIKSFVYDGVTLIGTNPAIPEANAKVLKFSEMVKETKRILKQESKFTASEKIKNAINKVKSEEGETVDFDKIEIGKGDYSIKVNKSKEAMSDKAWGDVDKTALMRKVLDAKNYATVVKSVYAKIEEGWKDSPSSHLKYPIMEVSGDNEAVYNRGGLSSALGYAKAENESAVVAKIMGIYKKMGLTKETTAEFDMTEEDYVVYMGIEVEIEPDDDEEDEKPEVETPEDEKKEEAEMGCHSAEEEKFTTDENAEGLATQIRSEMETETDKEEIEEDEKTKELRKIVAEMEAKVAELSTENEELKAFKMTILKQERMAKAEFELNEITKKKVMPEERMSYFKALAEEYEDMDKWAMELKAEAFGYEDVEGSKKEFSKKSFTAMPFNSDEKPKNSTGGIWDKLEQKYKK